MPPKDDATAQADPNPFLTGDETDEIDNAIDPDEAESADNPETNDPAPGKEADDANDTDDADPPAEAPAPKDAPAKDEPPAPAPAADPNAPEPPAPQPAPAPAPASDTVQDAVALDTVDRPIVDHFEYVRPAPKDYETEKQRLEAALDQLAEKFDDAAEDMSTTEFTRQQRALNNELTRLEVARQAHESDLSAAQQRMQADYGAVFKAWSAKVKAEGGPDYNEDAHFEPFKEALNLAEKRGGAKTLGTLFERAHRILQTLDGKPTPTPTAQTPSPNPTPRAPRANPPGPQTLAHLPSATSQAAGLEADPFAHIDSLPDDQQEEAIARMSETQRRQYFGG